MHRKEQILSQLYAENNRRQQTSDPETKQLIEQAVAFYKMQLKGLEKRMVEVVKQCEAFTEKAEILQSYPGVGPAIKDKTKTADGTMSPPNSLA